VSRTERGFTLDPFQVAAIAALDEGSSVLVAAPTGSGKTVVADHAIDRALAAGRRAFYTTPIKALSNQKFADLRARLGAERVGLVTGDTSVAPDADVVVMTTEVLRNMIYAGARGLIDLGVVVLDEVHYLQDRYRGPVWEEVIIHLPHGVTIVALSATVSNADELAGWIDAVRGRTVAIVEHERPVELHSLYAAHDRRTRDLTVLPVLVDGRPNPAGDRLDDPVVRGRAGAKGSQGGRDRARRRYATPRRPDVVEWLAEEDLLPAIVFVFSRHGCDEAAATIHAAGVRLTDAGERDRIRRIVDRHTGALRHDDLDALGFDRWREILEHGVAAHHAGMVPPFKEAVEQCFVEGLVKVVFATETLALGINMPARSVVIETLSKFTGEQHEPLTPGEYTQLTGRAGRRGIDELGRAVVLWSPYARFQEVAALVASRRFELRSAFRPTYNMAANLVRRHAPDEAERLLERSFAQYQADRGVVRQRARLEARRETLGRLEGEARCERGDVGEYLRLRRRDERDSDRRPDRQAITTALARLRPGDVVWTGGRRHAVLAVGWRGPDRGRVHLLDEQGRAHAVDSGDVDEIWVRAGQVDLPARYSPHDRAVQRQLARRLARADTPRPPRPPARRAAADDHPVAGCPDADAHVRAAVHAERVRREVADLEASIRLASHSIARELDAVLDVLATRRMVDGWQLTDRGELLVRIFHESDLLVADCLAEGLLDGLDPPSLAGLVSCFTYEHRSKLAAPAPRFPDRRLRQRFDQVVRRARALQGDEAAGGLSVTRAPDPTFLPAAHAWARGDQLDDVLAGADLSGGDFVRNVRQLADLLRQIGSAAPDPHTRRAARQAAEALHRGVVASAAAATTGGDARSPEAPVER